MFDLTRFARIAAWLLPIYLLCFPVLAILFVSLDYTLNVGEGFPFQTIMGVFAPFMFALIDVVLVIDFFRRLKSGRLTVTQRTGYRFVGGMYILATGFGLSFLSRGPTWIPVVIAVCCLALMCVRTRWKATPSTWKPS